MKPAQIRQMLKETIGDYTTFAFEADEEWDDDTRTTAKKAHENALKIFLTLFNDLSSFKTKTSAKASLRASYEQGTAALLDELVQECERKLKYTAGNNYSEYHERRSLNKLRIKIDPLMTSSNTYDHPAMWPLARHVQ
jgi:hypothetical protein